ncbi:MAG: response regulator [Roseivirga sp.]|nr:response regulator [Roseivirga sp.]
MPAFITIALLKHVSRSVFLLICLNICLTVSGQDYRFKVKSIGVEDGLTSRNIKSFFHDRDGLIWMGSDFGLNRYDGHEIRTFTQEKGQLVSNYVRWYAEDTNGKLWLLGKDPNLGNGSALQVFDPKTGKAESVSVYFKDKLPFKPTRVQGIGSFYGSADVWIVSDNGLFRYNPQESALPIMVVQMTPQIIDLQACSRGIWISERGKISLFDLNGQKIQQIDTNTAQEIYLHGLDRFDNVYYRRFLSGNKANNVTVAVIMSSNRLFGNSEESFWLGKRFIGIDAVQGHVWYDDEDENIYIYNESLKEIHRFKKDKGFFSYPKSVYFDRFGNGWTNHNGRVNIISLKKSNFTNYLTDVRTFGTNGYGARGLFVDKENHLYTNGLGSSYRINLSTGEREEFGPGQGFYNAANWGDQVDGKRLSLLGDNRGNIWYTDEGYRITRLNPVTGDQRDFTYSKEEKEMNEADPNREELLIHWSSFIDSQGRLWLGKDDGLSYIDSRDSTVRRYLDYQRFPELKKSQVLAFKETDEGIWIATQTGLYKMNLNYELIQRFHRGGEKGAVIPHNAIAYIYSENEYTLWLASKGGGLIRLDTKTGNFRQFTERDGLSDNTTYAIYADHLGRFWVPSDKGIMLIDTTGFVVTTYLKGDGLAQEEFNTLSHFQAKDGRLFFGHLNGVTAFDPQHFQRPENINANLLVTRFEKQSRQTGLYTNSLSQFDIENGVSLRPSEVGFTVGYSLLNYSDSESNRYSYKIEGIDQEWNYINEPFIRINALPFGQHRLMLRGQASQGLWSEVLSIPIRVLRPFYLSPYFIMALILVLSGITFLLIKIRERSLLARQVFLEQEIDKRTLTIREQANELKELDGLKSKFFANVSHELRTPLSLVVAPIRNLIKNPSIDESGKKDVLRVKKNSELIEKLVEEILDLTKLENKKVTPHYKAIRPTQFFSRLHNNFESKAQAEGIQFLFAFKGEDSGFALDVDMTERILNNLLSNAFKFTPPGKQIEIHIEINTRQLQVTVRDEGIGISEKDLPHVFDRFFQTKDSQRAASGGTGIGLALSKELAQAMNGDLTAESNSGQGSKFTLTLPNTKAEMFPQPSQANSKAKVKGDRTRTLVPGKKQQRILVVEDHVDMRTFITENLMPHYHTMEAGNGQEALLVLEKSDQRPDVIISDMMMPEMDGMELLENIRDRENLRPIPVIMLTARTADTDKLEAFRLGVDDYLIKPFSVDELKARIRNQLRVSESRRVANLVSEIDYNHDHTPGDSMENWLLKVKELTQENVHKVDFNIGSIAEKLRLSQRQFQRRLKGATGYTPGVYLKEIRLQMARVYLEKREYSRVQEVSMAVGFTSVNYFSRLYKSRFGKSPGEYF